MAVNAPSAPPQPHWPQAPFDPASARVHYNPLADELVVRFDDRPVPAYVDWIAAPAPSDLAVLVAIEPLDDRRGAVVGVQVDHLLARAAACHPAWWTLAEPDPARETVAHLVRHVAALFERYGVATD